MALSIVLSELATGRELNEEQKQASTQKNILSLLRKVVMVGAVSQGNAMCLIAMNSIDFEQKNAPD